MPVVDDSFALGQSAGMLTLETLPHQIRTGDVHTVVVAFPDLQGRPVGKRVTGSFFLEHVLDHGIEVCDYLLACDVDMDPLPGYEFTNWETGYGDLNAVIDPQTVRTIPWLPGSVLVLCDLLTMDGEPVEVSPRRILRRQIERAAERGYVVKCATELEFYLFLDSFAEAGEKRWQNLTPHATSIEDYQLLQTSREEYIIARIRNEMTEAGIPIEFSKGEAGIGQHEINITYSTALEVADRHLVFKNGVKEIAGEYGRAATFMAKWSMDTAGSSCHIHTSLWDATRDTPLMAPAEGTDTPSGFSQVGSQWIAGQVHAADQLAWCFAPYVNSYRRYVPDSWAPTAVVWGEDNRTCGFRAVGHGAGRRAVGYRPPRRPGSGLYRQRLPGSRSSAHPHHLARSHRQPRVERGGGRGLRPQGTPAPGQYRPPGVGQGQLGGHRLGVGPQLRTHLTPVTRPPSLTGGRGAGTIDPA
jgi:glutamine synthetase